MVRGVKLGCWVFWVAWVCRVTQFLEFLGYFFALLLQGTRPTGGIIMMNGDVKTIGGLKIEAVPEYNIIHMRGKGKSFHPKGVGNSHVITFGDKRVYVAGDAERDNSQAIT
jgi:hypothetical protein